MDQIKIGKFISAKRKEKKLTQCMLAEMLGVTDRAISKWENGRCLPDVGVMPDLCKILNISINDLFSGEVIDMKESQKKLEENLLEITKIKEQRDKELLFLEVFICVTVSIVMLVCILIATLVEMQNWLKVIFVIIGIIPFAFGICYAIRIEQIAGYYECVKCNYKHVPSYKDVFLAMHINRSRFIRCPKCLKKTWHKKVISK